MISIIFILWHLWWLHFFGNFAIHRHKPSTILCIIYICNHSMFLWHLWLYNGNKFYARIIQRFKCPFLYYLESQFSFLCIIIGRVVYSHLHLNDHVLSVTFFFVSLFCDLSDTCLFYFISIKKSISLPWDKLVLGSIPQKLLLYLLE